MDVSVVTAYSGPVTQEQPQMMQKSDAVGRTPVNLYL